MDGLVGSDNTSLPSSPTRPAAILIRTDASKEIGAGHVMRMVALAQAIQDWSGMVTLASATCPLHLAERLRGEGIMFESMAGVAPGSTADLNATVALGRSRYADWVVLDGYHFNVDYQRAVRDAGFRLLVVDDHGYSDRWAADAILNQNIFAPQLVYTSEVSGCRNLLGTRFVLLRREFREDTQHFSKACRARDTPIRRLLITLGGGSVASVTGHVLQALNLAAKSLLEVTVLINAADHQLGSLKRLISDSPHRVELRHNVRDMPCLYRWADGVVSAGGTTCWEWMFYALPAAVVCLSNNQRPVVASLAQHHLALNLGWHETLNADEMAQKLGEWLSCPNSLAGSPPPELVVDGQGAERVAALLNDSQIMVRAALHSDARLWFEWANDPAVRANGFHPDPIAWEDHLEWFERHRKSTGSRLWIGIDLEGHPVGYVRLHDRGGDEWEVGVAVAPGHRGQGIGCRLVELALRRFSRQAGSTPLSFRARVQPSNAASLRLFQTLGFVRDDRATSDECCVLTRKTG